MIMEFVPVNVYYPYIGQVILKIYQFSGVLIQRTHHGPMSCLGNKNLPEVTSLALSKHHIEIFNN